MPTLLPNSLSATFKVNSATIYTNGLPCARNVGPITVGCILDNLFRQIGLRPSQYNVSAATDAVDGMIIGGRTSVRDAIDDLLRIYETDLVEIDGQIVAKKRGASSVVTINEDDLGSDFWNGGSPSNVTKAHRHKKNPLEIPTSVDISYFTVAKHYETGHQRANRETKSGSEDKLTLNTGLTLTEDFARRACERMLYRLWIEDKTFNITVPHKYIYLCAGDVITLVLTEGNIRVRIVEMDIPLFGPVNIKAVLDEPEILTQTIAGGTFIDNGEAIQSALNTTLVAFSSNALRDIDADSVGFYAMANGATAGNWNGSVLYISRDGGSTYQALEELSDPASFGVTASVLPAPTVLSTGNWDRVSTVDVTIQAGFAPVSASLLEVLNGANSAYIGGEIVQYQTVTSLGGNNYRLSNLIRGSKGTESFWASHSNGERFAILENGGATVRINLDETLVGKTISLKAVTIGQTVAAATPVSLTITGNEFKPYAGCSLDGTRDISSNLTITWKRRTRKGGAWSDFVDVSLVDIPEAYEVEIWDSSYSTLKRTITGLSTSVASYSSANQVTDFGSNQAIVYVKIFQIGRYGRGYELRGQI